MDRVPCNQCEAMVLPATYERTDGLCMPCFKKPQKEAAGKQHAKDLKDEDLIDAGRRHFERQVGEQYKVRALENFRITYTVLLNFLSENNLLVEEFNSENVDDWYNFEVRYSMFTDRGIKLFDLCHLDWLGSLDRGNKFDYLGHWKKCLKNL